MKVAFHLFLVSFLFSIACYGQLRIIPSWDNKALELEQVYLTENNYSISFSTLKMYFSDFRFREKLSGGITEIDTLIFYDLADSSTHVFFKNLEISNYDDVSFTLGLDSSKNVSGELENAYDPLLGMHWAWNTGYVNVKLAGKSSLVLTKTHDFEFHLGGYRFPYASAQQVQVDLLDSYIQFELSLLFPDVISLKKTHHLMLPGKEAFLILQELAACFN
jgi:hypothetical protein